MKVKIFKVAIYVLKNCDWLRPDAKKKSLTVSTAFEIKNSGLLDF